MSTAGGRWAHLARDAAPAVDGVGGGDGGDGLLRSSAMVGVGTAVSRITGLLRIAALTYALGATALADGYNLANTTPNIVYDLLVGGILAATLVPLFVAGLDEDDEDGISAVVSVAVIALTAVTVIAILAAPLLFRLYTWAQTAEEAAEMERVGVPLLRLFLPQILLYGLTALGTAVLNARRRFAVPAFAPILNNLVVCAVLVWFAQVASDAPTVAGVADDRGLLWLLGLGTTAGILAMTVALWPSLRRSGVRLRWRPRFRDPAVRRLASLSGWTFGYVVANQVTLALVLALAARDTGGASAYTYAFAFFQLPYGLFAVSIMTTFTPDLAAAANRDDLPAFRERFAMGARVMTLVVLPAGIGMAVLARPLVEGLLGRGAFGGDAPQLTADVLACFAVGVVGFSLFLYVMRGFYALHDTRTPFLLNLGNSALNLVLAFALVGRWGVQGVAFSYSVSYLAAAVVAVIALRRRVGRLGGRRFVSALARMATAGLAMGVTVYLASRAIGTPDGAGAVVRLAVGTVLGVAVYVVAVAALRVDDARSLVDRLLRRGVA